jgi:hypothetical protein
MRIAVADAAGGTSWACDGGTDGIASNIRRIGAATYRCQRADTTGCCCRVVPAAARIPE